MLVQPIKRESASAACAAALRRAILEGSLQAGQRLPPERKLAADFGVNRLTLRSALAQLLAMGLVKVKQGSGYTVADVSRVGGMDLLPEIVEMARERSELTQLVSDLLDLRRSLASTLLARLSQTAGEDDFTRLDAAIAKFALLTESEDAPVSDFVEADFAIVAAMVDGIKSPILRMCINPVVLAVEHIKELAEAMYIDPKDNLDGHRLLLTWLRQPSLAPLSKIIDELKKRDEKTVSRLRRKERRS